MSTRIASAVLGLAFVAACSSYPTETEFLRAPTTPAVLAGGKEAVLEVRGAAPPADIAQLADKIRDELQQRGWAVVPDGANRLVVTVTTYMNPSEAAKASGGTIAFMFTGHTLGIGETKIAADTAFRLGDKELFAATVSARSSHSFFNATAHESPPDALKGVQAEFAKRLVDSIEANIAPTTGK